MPNIYIDNVKIEAQIGETVMQAAHRNGIEIPHFCWHPELAVVGNCRMCLVEVGTPKRNSDGSYVVDADGQYEIGFMPKLQIACNTVATDEMRILTKSPKAIKAQEAVMEFLLINHPLDCPICDEAGQCKLQEYTQRFSTGVSRFDERKNAKPKRVEWNDKIMYDAERCIACTRCVRLTRDVFKEDVLTFINRCDKIRIDRFEDVKVMNNYSMNVIDVCPVGALTSRDFRFKARVWEMSFTNSICPGCSRGCNIKIGVRNNEILRLEPRENLNVNKHWMCDEGRLAQHESINKNRLLSPMLKGSSASWDEAIKSTVSRLRKYKPNEIFFLASPLSSNENNYLLTILAKQGIKTSINNIAYIERTDNSFGDDFLRTSNRSPNQAGLEALGLTSINISALANKISSKEIKALYVLDENFKFYDNVADNAFVSALSNLEFLVVHAYTSELAVVRGADVVFPAATFAEMDGTFTNFEKRVQYFYPAVVFDSVIRENSSRLDKFGAHNDKWTQHERRDIKPSWKILQEITRAFCSLPMFKTSENIFEDISKNIKLFAEANYSDIKKNNGYSLKSK